MFSSVGWAEVLVILVAILLFIGPERLPGLIHEVRAVLLAIRNAVGQAREQLDNEFGDEMKTFAQPLSELNNVRKMGPRGFITKTLLDGDESFLTPLDEAKETAQALQKKGSLRDFARGASTTAGVPNEDGAGRDVDVPEAPQESHTTNSTTISDAVEAGGEALTKKDADTSSTSASQWDDVV